MGQPSAELIGMARKQGYRLACRRGRQDMAEDFMSEAVCVLLVEWPKLSGRFEVVPVALVRHVVMRRLADWCRQEFGRGGRWKPHTQIAGPLIDQAALDDTAGEATAFTSAYLIERVMAAQRPNLAYPAERRASLRRRLVLGWIAEGRSQAWMSRRLGVSEAAISRLLASTVERALRDRAVRALDGPEYGVGS